MSSSLYRLARAVVRGRGWVLVGWLALLAVLGTGAAYFQQGMETKFEIPGAESQDTLDHLNNVFPQMSGSRAQLVVIAPDGQRIDSPQGRQVIEDAVHEIEGWDGVSAVLNPFSDIVDNQVSPDGRSALINAQFELQATQVPQSAKDALIGETAELEQRLGPGSEAHVGGEVFSMNVPSVGITEGVGVVIALLVLLLMLRSLVAAVMPLITALVGVGVSMTFVLLCTAFTTVSSAAPMLGMMLGLAVGIDYSLFIVSRHREQLAEGVEVRESIARAVATAGSAVIFAGVTVIIALLALAVPGIPFLTTMGVLAGVSIAVGVGVALTMIPALLAFAGERLRPKRRRRSTKPRRKLGLAWVRAVTKAPLLTVVVVVAGLGVCAIPAADLRLSVPDASAQPVGSPARDTYDAIAQRFGPGYNSPLIVTADIIGSKDPLGMINGMADEIRELPGVAAVPMATPNETIDTGIIQVVPTTGGEARQTEDLVHRLRAMSPHFEREYGSGVKVTGMTAVGIDLSEKISQALLPFGIIVVGLTLVLLAMVFRSVWVPIKAALGYLLSVGATFGATAFVFNQGHLSELLNISHVGGVISFLPLLLMAILFGLAMDYQVFLVSRMREDYSRHGDARRAIESGFTNVSPVVLAAAVIMIAVFAAFVPHGDSNIKPIAFGLAVGVFVDAFLVRMTLVPAVMALLGDKAWWLPGFLARKLPALDVEGEALQHELRLTDWPGNDEVVSARGLAVHDDRGASVVGGVHIALRPGEVLAVTGSRAESSALLHALGGRARTVRGDLRVLGHLLPQRARAVRSRVALVRCRDSAAPASEIARAIDEGVPLVLVAELDAVADDAQRADIAHRIATAPGVTFVVTHQNPALTDGLLPADRSRSLRLSARAGAPTAGRLLEV